jgi:hypothetical protein
LQHTEGNAITGSASPANATAIPYRHGRLSFFIIFNDINDFINRNRRCPQSLCPYNTMQHGCGVGNGNELSRYGRRWVHWAAIVPRVAGAW